MKNPLEVLGALVVRTIDTDDDYPKRLRRLITEAEAAITPKLDEKQYRLWERVGEPDVEFTKFYNEEG